MNYIEGIPGLTECRFKGWFVKTAAKYLSMQNPAGKKKCGRLGRIREGYKTLNSEEEVCISRVAYILVKIPRRWNVAN